MSEIQFAVMRLIEENDNTGERFIDPEPEVFEQIPRSFNFTFQEIFYDVSFEQADSYVWLASDYGKPNPKDENLTDVLTGEKRENQRGDNEAELISQLFCLYDFQTKRFYVSNSKKISFLECILNDKASKKFIIKSVKKSKNEFMNLLKTVKEISFTEERNLFAQNSKERKALIDLTGTDAPESFKITANYSANNGERIRAFIEWLFAKKSDQSLKDLIICGTDENKFDVVFNNDTFLRKTVVFCEKNENGKFLPDCVKNTLLAEIAK